MKHDIERTGISRDRALFMRERHSEEVRPCISCGTVFTAIDVPSDEREEGKFYYRLSIMCGECSDSGIEAKDISPARIDEWLKAYGPNRKKLSDGNLLPAAIKKLPGLRNTGNKSTQRSDDNVQSDSSKDEEA